MLVKFSLILPLIIEKKVIEKNLLKSPTIIAKDLLGDQVVCMNAGSMMGQRGQKKHEDGR